MPHNIEKSAFRAKEYIGYGSGLIWRIRKSGANWFATSEKGHCKEAQTLRDISALI
jgi:hypothetical protein